MIISHIPNQSGVYFFKDKSGNILYIGKAKNLQKRVSQYFSPGSVWKQEMISQAESVDFVIVKNESEALYLEDNLIKKHKPYYNNMLKGSNSYAYIKITKEDFPQIFITRKKFPDGSTYIGPKHNTIQLKNFLQYLRQVLQYRGCKISQFRQGKLCSDHYFGLCKGRCDKKLMSSGVLAKDIKGKKSYSSLSRHCGTGCSEGQKTSPQGQSLEEYKSIINYITSFFRGDIKPIQKEILNQIQFSIASENFERAAKLRDIYNNIDGLSQQQTVVIKGSITGYIFKIKKIGTWFVYVLLYFNQGKLVDIIRHKFHQDDSDFASIIGSITNECGEFYLNPEKIKPSLEQISGINKSIKKLSKSDQKEIDYLIEGFFDSYIISTSFEGENLNNDLLSQLQTRYKLKKFPYHIECIDISHLGGSRTSGGLSCFLGGLPERKYYRRYKIANLSSGVKTKDIKGKIYSSSSIQNDSNDYASLKELIIRRFNLSLGSPKSKVESPKLMTGRPEDLKTGGLNIPDLFILDGGKGQLGIVRELYKSDKAFQKLFSEIDFISLGKGEARKKSRIGQSGKNGIVGEKIYYFDTKFTIKSIDLVYDQADKILVNIRNEAHRFSNAYREKQMSKPWR